MRKFYKILTLILVLMAILTAFTVVALADEEEPALTPVTPVANAAVFKDGTFSTFTPDTVYQNAIYNNAPKTGVWNIHGSDDGNVYLQSEYDVGGSGAHDNLDMYINYNANYNIVAYPYTAIDFDIMTENGTFGDYASIGATVHKNGANRIDMSSTYIYNIGLDTTPYKWQHVTYIVVSLGNGVFEHYFFIDGEYSYNKTTDYSTNTAITSLNGDLSGLALYFFRMYPSIRNNAAGNGKIGYDNFKFTLFPAGYCTNEQGVEDLSKIATYVYDENYKLPYGLTEAKIGDAVYDDANKAIEAANDNDTVRLTMNTDDILLINKNILLDINVYDDEGNPTGAFYTYEYKSSKGLVPTETEAGSGIYSFARSANAVDIIWDEKCNDECNCFAEYGGHRLTATTTVLLGAIPEYFEETPTWEISQDYSHKKFLGWSYENDGTVDQLIPISENDIAAGTAVKLYPVYKTVTYGLEVTSVSGVDYYLAEEFADVVALVPSGATVKLLSDVYTEMPKYEIKKSLTIDLNGHTLKRCFVYGNVYQATKEGDEFVYGTENPETVASGGDIFFRVMANNVNLTITSSIGGGTLYNFKMDADTWMYNGEVVKRDSKAITPARLTNANESGAYTSWFELHLNGGITIYAGQAFYSIYASGVGYVIDIDDVTYYKLDGVDFIHCRTNYEVDINISNSLIYAPNNGGNFMFLGTSGSAAVPEYSKVNITNCDIIKAGTGWGLYGYNSRPDGYTKITYDNCRLYDAGAQSTTAAHVDVVGINGTLGYYYAVKNAESTPVNPEEGWSQETVSIPVTYYVPGTTFAATTDTINVPTFDYPANIKHTITYNRVITKEVDVNWVDENGNTVKTEKLMPGVSAIEGPRVVFALDSDDYRNILAQWVDEDGKAVGAKLAVTEKGIDWQDSYTFRAVETIDGTYKYTGGIKDILFNISFTSNFRYNLYLPERDSNITFNSISTLTKGELVKIGGVEYRVYSYIAGTAEAADNAEVTVNFTVDGVTYDQIFKLNALLYADIILASSNSVEEKLAVGNMARFIMEARKVVGAEVDEERFNAIISGAGVEDYKAEYSGDGSIANLSDYIYSVSYVIYNGSASYKFVLNDAAYADVLNFNLGGKEIGFTVAGVEGDKTYIILNTARVYDIIDTLTITVDGTELIATYSMLDNIKANPNSDLLKALYEFGIAAENYRAYLQALAEE